MLSLDRVAHVDRLLRHTESILSEVRCGVSAAARALRAQGHAAGNANGERELRLGSLLHPPVMLVHGLGADKSCFSVMEDFLHRAGYTVYSVSYSCVNADIEQCARTLERETGWLLDQTGADRVHVVAHSLGGVILRWAVVNTRMAGWLRVGITLGSPHRGTPAAHLAPSGLPGLGRIVAQLRPGALTIDDGGLEGLEGTRWIALAGEHDVIVPAKYARLPRATNVRNAVVPLAGHMTLTRSLHCLAIILRELAADGESRLDAVNSPDVSTETRRPTLCA